jgi:hypothetical protein
LGVPAGAGILYCAARNEKKPEKKQKQKQKQKQKTTPMRLKRAEMTVRGEQTNIDQCDQGLLELAKGWSPHVTPGNATDGGGSDCGSNRRSGYAIA